MHELQFLVMIYTSVCTDTHWLFGLSSPSNFVKGMAFWKPTLFPTSGKEAPNLVGPLDGAVTSHWETYKL